MSSNGPALRAHLTLLETAGNAIAACTIGAAARLLRWHRNRRAERQLEALPDELLADIGISRSMIGIAVRRGRPRADGNAPALPCGVPGRRPALRGRKKVVFGRRKIP